MIKNYTLLALALLFSASIFAKHRNIDLSTRLVSPTSGTSIKSNQNFNFAISVKNNGTDTITTTDTLEIFILVDSQLDSFNFGGTTAYGLVLFPSSNLIPGDSITTAPASISLTYPNSMYGTHSFCGAAIASNNTDSIVDASFSNNAGCTSLLFDTTAKATGVNSLTSNDNLSIFPNPAKTKLNINNNGLTIKSIEVIDVLGRVVLATIAEEKMITLNVENLKNGIYFLKTTTDNNVTTTTKFIKE